MDKVNKGKACENCGNELPEITVQVTRRINDNATRPQLWCLDCVQGKNPVSNMIY
jgi:hypothetical protein